MSATQNEAVPAQDPRPGQTLEGFVVEQVTPLPGLRATAVRARHTQSGADFLHLYAPADTENCFAVTFPTPPPDSTGVPHILEHAVLGGSRKFPVREPFFEMVKMSMATFINAMTAQAYTVYPVSSNVRKDFFNLTEVYLDAVFHPELKEATFRREGHHFTLENNADLASPLKLSGIVYSEMKGASSMPERLMYQLAGCGLYPDTPLGRDSGGDPECIPDLTYEQFLRFHRELYHPANALIYVYGDIPTAEILRFLAPVLNDFDRQEARILAPRQPRWTAPRQVERGYPIGPGEDAAARTFMTLNWLVGDGCDPDATMDWNLLSTLLLGNEGAPLKKALIDSKLGADVFFAGAWGSAYEQEFHVGLKGSEPERVEAFEKLVLETLGRLAAEGFATERIEAACQQLAYHTLEVNSLFPLHLLDAVDSAWPYGADPLTFLRAREHLEACRARTLADPARLGRLIDEALLRNPHRLRVLLRPDREAQARADAAFAERMAAQRARLSPPEIATIAKDATALAAAQGVPNSPEALAKLPQLKTSDLPPKPRHIPTEVRQVAGTTLLRNDVFANGVNYLEVSVDLAGLPVELYAWLPRFCEAVNKMGVLGQPFDRVAERRAACTGGLWCSTQIVKPVAGPAVPLRRLRFGLKTLDGQAGKALQLLDDILFSVDPRDRERLRDVLAQTQAWFRTTLVNDGSGTARRQAARGLSPEAAMEHLFVSPDALRRMVDLNRAFDTRVEEAMESVERIRAFLASGANWTASFTGSDGVFKTLTKALRNWSGCRGAEPADDDLPPFHAYLTPPREGLAGPMMVAHCAKVMPAPHLSHPDVPLFRLGAYLANFDILLPEIRFKGNAYGAGAYHDDGLGTFVLYSFRDPHIVETLDVFDRLRDTVAAQAWTQTDIDRAIIGSAKDAEKPIRPAEATGTALIRYLRGDTPELREQRYATMLGATPQTVKDAFLDTFDAHAASAAVCVVSSREKLDEANRRLGDRGLAVSDILG